MSRKKRYRVYSLPIRIYYILRRYQGTPLTANEISYLLGNLNCKQSHLSETLSKLAKVGLVKRFKLKSFNKYELAIDDINEWRSVPVRYLELLRKEKQEKNGKKNN